MHFPRNLRGVVVSFLEVIAIKDSSKALLLWMFERLLNIPTGSTYGTFTPHLVDFKVNPNVGKYTIHGSYGSVWLTWKPRMIEYCWIQSMLHESSHQNRVWLGEVIHGEVLFYDLHWANGCVYLKAMKQMFCFVRSTVFIEEGHQFWILVFRGLAMLVWKDEVQ